MLTVGLIGGMSWESSQLYYRLLNQGVKRRLGGLHSASCLMYSVDFAEIEALQHAGDWDAAGERLAAAARAVQAAGADCLVLCTNTMHKVAPSIEAAVSIPFLHIGDASAAAIRAAGLDRVGLLGTRFTMEQEFYRDRLARHGLEVLVPEPADRELVHRVIYAELCQGRCEADSRRQYRRIIGQLAAAGAEAILLGCTEIGLLVGAQDSPVPVFDSTEIHAAAAVSFALGEAASA